MVWFELLVQLSYPEHIISYNVDRLHTTQTIISYF